MSMTDPIMDMLTRIRNSQSAGKAGFAARLEAEGRRRQGAERRRLHRRSAPSPDVDGKPQLTIALKLLPGPPGHRDHPA